MEIETIYEIIARKHGVPADEVKAEMQRAISVAWLNPRKTPEESAHQQSIPSKGSIPTPEEVITYVKDALQFH